MVSNGNVNIYIERVLVDIGEHKSKVSAVIKFNSLQSEFTTHPAGTSLVSVVCDEINRFCSHWSQWQDVF